MILRIAGLLFGVAFGLVLSWGRVSDYDAIQDMLLFKDPYLFFMMGTCMVTAAVGARLLKVFGAKTLVDGSPVTWSTVRPQARHILGSLLFGTGWAVAGTCPGPVAAQIGEGRFAGLFTFVGLLAGVALRDWQETKSRAPQAEASAERPSAAIGL